MATKYRVYVTPDQVFSYEVEATNENEAIEMAKEYAMQETQYDLLKWASYETELIEGE